MIDKLAEELFTAAVTDIRVLAAGGADGDVQRTRDAENAGQAKEHRVLDALHLRRWDNWDKDLETVDGGYFRVSHLPHLLLADHATFDLLVFAVPKVGIDYDLRDKELINRGAFLEA